MTLDVEGNVIGSVNAPGAGNVADQTAVFRVDRSDASISKIASGVADAGETLFGIAYEPVGEQIFVGTSMGRIRRIDSNGVVTPFSDLGPGSGAVNGLAIAPPSVLTHAGQIYVTSSLGRLWRVNPTTGFPTVTTC